MAKHQPLKVFGALGVLNSFFRTSKFIPLPTLLCNLMQETIVVRTPCRAMIASAVADELSQQCETTTRRGCHCAHHADQLLGLAVKTSLLGEPGEAGLGLFTTRDRDAWTIVDEYLGDVMPTAVFNTRSSNSQLPSQRDV